MSAPTTNITKLSAAAVQAFQAVQVLAIIAPCVGSAGLPINTPTNFSDTGSLQTAGVEGPGVEYGDFFIRNARKTCLLVRPSTTTAGFYYNASICGGSAGIAVTAVPSNGPPAHLTVTGHGLATGDVVVISGAVGDTAINGTWVATVIDANTLSIPVTGTGTYTASSATCVWTGMQYVGTGTAVPSFGSAAGIADDYSNVTIQVLTGGTLGTSGIVVQCALDGVTFGAPVAIGTALTFTPLVPITGASSGVIVNLGASAATLIAGDVMTFSTTGPRMNSADLTSALAALKATNFAYDLVLVHGETTPALVTVQDSWSTSLSSIGQFPLLFSNTRHKNQQAGETDAAFQTAMSTLLSTVSTINVVVGTDAADGVSGVSGLTKALPVALYITTRLEGVAIGVDAARVSDGPIPNANITLPNGLPKWHNEQLEAGLDSTTIRLSTLRTFPDRSGTYITNAYVLSGTGSSYIYAQHARVMNAACRAAYTELNNLLSSGFPTSPTTGKILPAAAMDIQKRVQAAVNAAVNGQLSGVIFSLSQNDVNVGNGPSTLTGSVKCEALEYVKTWNVSTQYVQTLS